ncbi:glycosyltransferase family A protein [Erysipelothrix rhusiopathiae]|uniref:Glycosyltransferase family 2 protein n=1 Tax=Erysipelothrix rhusiopathiae TaxID=1648 RepID=A0A6S6I134_ERYRH|nr:glycosyltransferase family A protein [Erysipelothrix rhusiopathiae]BCB22718.1 glycosyltransferase family 2 protein [Erysipelothrix rhusiopathiae]
MEILFDKQRNQNLEKLLWLSVGLIPAFSDWKINFINLGDLLILTSLIFMILIFNKDIIGRKSISLALTLIIISIVNVLYHSIFTTGYDSIKGILYIAKISVFSFFVAYTYELIYGYNKFDVFLKINTKIAIALSIIGISITMLLLFGSEIPQKIIWIYTRSDRASYTFRGTNIIRMRSLFSEPSYFGIYLNMIIALNLFRSSTRKVNYSHLFFLCLSVFLTFAFSGIVTLILILFLFFIKNRSDFLKNRKLILVLTTFLVLLSIIFSKQIYETIILRAIVILDGTDTSAINRIFGSWKYIGSENIVFGNGFGHTPAIWNNIAYVLSDLGLIGLSYFAVIIICNFKINHYLTTMFIAFSFQRGGYMNSYYWYSILMIILYTRESRSIQNTGNIVFEEDITVLISTMNQVNIIDIQSRNISVNSIIFNQITDPLITKYSEMINKDKSVMYSCKDKGIGKSRNNLISRCSSKISILADDDMIFNDNFEKTVVRLFNNFPDADVLVFNLDNMGSRYLNKSYFDINKNNFERYGAARIAFRTDSVKKERISFSEKFGGGCIYSSGEDTIFLNDCLEAGLKIVAVPDVIARLEDSRPSTWFKGYDEKYYFDKGALFASYTKKIWLLKYIVYSLRKAKLSEGRLSKKDVFTLMLNGRIAYTSLKTYESFYNSELQNFRSDACKISVVIPAYNARESISSTLDSVLNQTYKNFEIVIVDDGSTDDTLKLLYGFAEANTNVIVLSQKNNGVSSARNKGIENISGDYVLFLDSDDTIEKNYMEEMIEQAVLSDSSLVICSYNLITSSGKQEVYNKFNSKDPLIDYLLYRVRLQTSCFMINRSFLDKFRYNEGLNWGEDIYFFSKLLANAKDISFVNKPLVNYNCIVRDGKLSNFSMNKIDLEFEYMTLMVNDHEIIKNQKIKEIISNYRLIASLTYKLLEADRNGIDSETIRISYLKYEEVINKKITFRAGLRTVKLWIARQKLRRRVIVKSEK